MFRALFAALTGAPRRGQELFDVALAEAGKPDWFIAGDVPDTINGRFAVLATIVALITVRLERDGSQGEQASVALTERLVETLDTEIREMGVGDPTLGKQVRKLVGAVSGRIERWRALVGSDGSWADEAKRSLYLDEPPGREALEHSANALRSFWNRLSDSDIQKLTEGRIG